jgi:RecB family exonuclease
MQRALLYLGEAEDGPGEAADTGSLTHLGVAAYHRADSHEKGVEAGYAAVRDGLERFPRADRAEAGRHLEAYVLDSRNQEAEVVAVEQPVSLVLPAAPGDPTGQDIHLQGTVDQVRRHEGGLLVFDVKTGSTPGWQMLHDHLFQLCAYAAGATRWAGAEVLPGYLIRTQSYRKQGVDPRSAPEGVFWGYRLTRDQCQLYLDQVREHVAQVRAGAVRFGPGAHCSYCPLGGIWNCTARAEKYF